MMVRKKSDALREKINLALFYWSLIKAIYGYKSELEELLTRSCPKSQPFTDVSYLPVMFLLSDQDEAFLMQSLIEKPVNGNKL